MVQTALVQTVLVLVQTVLVLLVVMVAVAFNQQLVHQARRVQIQIQTQRPPQQRGSSRSLPRVFTGNEES
jgi:hypothetical protein